MRAAVAVSQAPDNPLSGLHVKEVDDPTPPPGWARVKVRAASLNMHDLWTLRGVGHPAERLPMILGCDAAGVTEDGREVVLHPMIADADAGFGDETLDPNRALLSERHDGAFAEWVVVPQRCLVDKPAHLSFEEAACLPVAWGTAYRMLFTQGEVRAGDRVLVQGASGGVVSAAITMAKAAGAKVYVTSRTEEKREYARSLGADEVFESGARLPERVDVVVETVGAATWGHSLRCLRPGGAIVCCGATTGGEPPAELHRVFYQQLRVLGSTGSTLTETKRMLRMVETMGLRPKVDQVYGLDEIHAAFERMASGDFEGKLVIGFPA
ncbi:zinc-binding dehydrogenase [Mariniluteicoccus endophyticus]